MVSEVGRDPEELLQKVGDQIFMGIGKVEFFSNILAVPHDRLIAEIKNFGNLLAGFPFSNE